MAREAERDRAELERAFVDDLRGPRVADRRLELVVRARVEVREPARVRLELGPFERARLEADDVLPARDLVSPFSRRILLTVRAATSSARPP